MALLHGLSRSGTDIRALIARFLGQMRDLDAGTVSALRTRPIGTFWVNTVAGVDGLGSIRPKRPQTWREMRRMRLPSS